MYANMNSIYSPPGPNRQALKLQTVLHHKLLCWHLMHFISLIILVFHTN